VQRIAAGHVCVIRICGSVVACADRVSPLRKVGDQCGSLGLGPEKPASLQRDWRAKRGPVHSELNGTCCWYRALTGDDGVYSERLASGQSCCVRAHKDEWCSFGNGEGCSGGGAGGEAVVAGIDSRQRMLSWGESIGRASAGQEIRRAVRSKSGCADGCCTILNGYCAGGGSLSGCSRDHSFQLQRRTISRAAALKSIHGDCGCATFRRDVQRECAGLARREGGISLVMGVQVVLPTRQIADRPRIGAAAQRQSLP